MIKDILEKQGLPVPSLDEPNGSEAAVDGGGSLAAKTSFVKNLPLPILCLAFGALLVPWVAVLIKKALLAATQSS